MFVLRLHDISNCCTRSRFLMTRPSLFSLCDSIIGSSLCRGCPLAFAFAFAFASAFALSNLLCVASSSKWVGSSPSGRETRNRFGDSRGAAAVGAGAGVGDVVTGAALAAAKFSGPSGLSERRVGLLLRCVARPCWFSAPSECVVVAIASAGVGSGDSFRSRRCSVAASFVIGSDE